MSQTGEQVQTVLDALVQALSAAAAYDHNDQTGPAAVIWPDKARLWEPLLPRLRARLPLLTLGDYAPPERSGPAYWLRCVLAGVLPDCALPAEATPIVYLPGWSRQDLRAHGDCPHALQPLAELQYRGVIWSHENGRDWTPGALLQAQQPKGLGVEVASDAATREALARVLPKLAEQPVARLQAEGRISAAFLDDLLTPDAAYSVLRWLNEPDAFRASLDAAEWAALCARCSKEFAFHPESDGILSAVARLPERRSEQPWDRVWQRFCEAPARYPGLVARLLQCSPSKKTQPLFDRGAWPQENDSAELNLRTALAALHDVEPQQARARIADLEAAHGQRRGWVWAQLGRAPLAQALAPLAKLATLSAQGLGGPTIVAIAEKYVEGGWRVDAAALAALGAVREGVDVQAVGSAVRTIYKPWLEDAAFAFQAAALAAGGYQSGAPLTAQSGECLLFSDGLRYDAAQRLAAVLSAQGCTSSIGHRLTALPSVTTTAKPAVSPVAAAIMSGPELAPCERRADGTRGAKVEISVLRRLLADADYQVLQGTATGDPSGRAWTESGNIDGAGHGSGIQLARDLDSKVLEVAERIRALLEAGWWTVTVVTDHGWLLLPGDLPTTKLEAQQTVAKKGRCARLKADVTTDYTTLPWYWDSNVPVAFASGICCFDAGKEYEHGGLSAQECVTPVLTITRAGSANASPAAIKALKWTGFRCTIDTDNGEGKLLDLRRSPNDATSTVLEPKADGSAYRVPDTERCALYADDGQAGAQVWIVVLGETGAILAQHSTTVGG